MDDYYEKLATYDETVAGLDRIRDLVSKEGLANFPGLERLLADSGLESKIPNPGFVLKKFVYDSTTKFEKAGDREITKEEEKEFSGLSGEGYGLWTQDMFPKIVKAQIDYCNERNILNIDGKAEIVAYRGMPVVTDFLCTPDENRLMIITKVKGKELAIPSNKEIQRAIYRKEGVYSAIEEAKHMALQKGDVGQWRNYFPAIIQDRKIDLQGVTDYSCDLMSYAIAEVANRALGKDMFPAKPVSIWVNDFVPYASRIVRQ
jgi:hypothetical protein